MIKALLALAMAVLTVTLVWASVFVRSAPPASAFHELGLQVVQRLRVDGPINAVAFDGPGDKLAALSGYGSIVSIFDVPSGNLRKSLNRYGGGYSANSLAFLSNGNILLSTPVGDATHDSHFNRLPLLDPKHGKLDNLALMQVDPTAVRVIRYLPARAQAGIREADTFAVSPDGQRIAAIVGQSVAMFDATTGTVEGFLDVPAAADGTRDLPRSLAFSPTQDELAVGTMDGAVLFFDARNGNITRFFIAYPDSEYAVGAIAYSPDGRSLVTGKYKNFDGERRNGIWVNRKRSLIEANIWSVDGGQMSTSLPGESLPGEQFAGDAPLVRALAWTRSLLVICDDGSVRFWRIDGSSTQLVGTRHLWFGCYSLASSRNGMIAAAHADEIVVYGQKS